MSLLNRRVFFGASVGGLASAFLAGHGSVARDEPVQIAPPPRPAIEPLQANLLPQDTLFLSWQRDPTTTITIQWLANETTENTDIRCVPRLGDKRTTGKTVTRPWPKSNLKVYRCELTGLTPNTEYLFQIGKALQAYRFRTMPAKATDTIQWVSGGDCGTGTHAIGTNILAAKQEPYFALIGGDLGYDNGISGKTALAFLRNYAKHMIDPKGRLIPMVTCIGNHEVRGGYKRKREDGTFYLPLFDGLYKDTTYATLDFGDYLSLVLLDTGHVSPIDGAQTEWLGGVLKERQDRPHLIVVNHVPAYPSYRNPGSSKGGVLDLIGLGGSSGTGAGNRKHWCPLFERYGVDAVLEHHDHTFKRTHPLKGGMQDKYGVPYLGDGSWGKLRTPNSPEKRPYLAKVSKAYHMTVHRLEGDQRYHVALEETGRVADVYATFGKRPAKRG
ncbi:MAG: metallophosphoesterase family protein [Planctomycetia bacterium]|nr:metallophosphoesterase family protein [Planctomycetia bacterium]